jgi:hypothetical protein
MGSSRLPKSRPDFLITYNGNVATLDVLSPGARVRAGIRQVDVSSIDPDVLIPARQG